MSFALSLAMVCTTNWSPQSTILGSYSLVAGKMVACVLLQELVVDAASKVKDLVAYPFEETIASDKAQQVGVLEMKPRLPKAIILD